MLETVNIIKIVTLTITHQIGITSKILLQSNSFIMHRTGQIYTMDSLKEYIDIQSDCEGYSAYYTADSGKTILKVVKFEEGQLVHLTYWLVHSITASKPVYFSLCKEYTLKRCANISQFDQTNKIFGLSVVGKQPKLEYTFYHNYAYEEDEGPRYDGLYIWPRFPRFDLNKRIEAQSKLTQSV